MATAWPLPDVPSGQILDFDFFEVEPVDGDLHAGYHRYHDGPPLFYTPHNGGHWVATRADLIYEIFRDYDRFSNRGIALFRNAGDEPHFIPGELDPPIHGAFRTHLNPELSPRRVRSFQDRARELTRDLIEEVAAKGRCEFQSAIGARMPIYNYMAFIGLPLEDADILLEHVEIIGRSADFQAFQAALGFVQDYLADQIERRRRQPVDDFLGRLAHAQIGDREITPHEAKVTALNVVLGGLDTVTASMGFFMNFLARNPGHRLQLLEDRGLIPEAMEELLRRHGIFNTARLVREDIDFHGTRLRKNDLVLVPTTLYNLDPVRFDRPLDVDFRRPDKNHMTFAVGIHRCLGSNFARIQLQVLLEEWLERIPEFAITPGAETIVKSGRTNSVMELPLAW